MPEPATLAARIAAGDIVHGADGNRITLAWSLSISRPKQVTVHYACTPARPQLLHVEMRGGNTIANGMTTTAFVVRCNRTPSPITFEAIPNDDQATLYLWNGWTVAGIDQAWLGNAGICELPSEGETTTNGPTDDGSPDAQQKPTERFRLACSDGVGAASFTDLTATITVAERPSGDR